MKKHVLFEAVIAKYNTEQRLPVQLETLIMSENNIALVYRSNEPNPYIQFKHTVKLQTMFCSSNLCTDYNKHLQILSSEAAPIKNDPRLPRACRSVINRLETLLENISSILTFITSYSTPRTKNREIQR